MSVRPEELDLHDAIFDQLHVDIEHQFLSVHVNCYLSHESRSRVMLRINFLRVYNLFSSLDFISLQDNKRSGNAASWHLDMDRRVAHIYLVNGYVSIFFKEIEIEIL